MDEVDDEVLELAIEADRRSSSQARRAIGAWLTSRSFPDRHIDDWLLVVSEVVTNAVVHAATPARIVVRWNGERVLLEVFDRNPGGTPRVLADPPTVGGRGLYLVDRLSTEWGFSTNDDGKCVWATLEMSS